MIENTENTTPATEVVYGSAYVDGLTRQITELEQKLSWVESGRKAYIDTIDKVTKHIQASIDNGDWTDEELDEIFWEELAEILDLELTKAIDIEITARWTATVRIKRGQSLDDLDISVDEPEAGYGVELENLYQRDFDIEEA